MANTLSTCFTTENALQLYALGCKLCAPLKKKAMDYITLETRPVFSHALKEPKALAVLETEHTQELMGSDGLVLKEEDVYAVVVQWGKYQQSLPKPPGQPSSVAECIAPLLPCVRWSRMSHEALLAVGREGLVPGHFLTEYLLGTAEKHRPRTMTLRQVPEDSAKPFWVQHVYSPAHKVVVWQRPCTMGTLLSEEFEVGGLKFIIRATRNGDMMNLLLHHCQQPDMPPSQALVFARFSCLRTHLGGDKSSSALAKDAPFWLRCVSV